MGTARIKVEYLGGAEIRYLYPCGHTRKDIIMIGPKGPGSKRLRKPMAPAFTAKLVNYWNQSGGVSTRPCPKCRRKTLRQRSTPDQSWKRILGQKIRYLTPVQCQEKLAAITAEGITMFHPTIRELTGGLNSQSINFFVIRKLAEKAKEKS